MYFLLLTFDSTSAIFDHNGCCTSFCVTNLPIPHAFFRHGPVFLLFIINFFDIQQGPFLWSDKFENDF